MQYIVGGIIIVALLVVGYMGVNYIEYKKRGLSVINKPDKKKGDLTHLVDSVDNLPFVHDQTVALLNAQVEELDKLVNAGKMSKEEAMKVIKPLKDKVSQMETLMKVPQPILRIGAALGDKVVKKVGDAVDNFG